MGRQRGHRNRQPTTLEIPRLLIKTNMGRRSARRSRRQTIWGTLQQRTTTSTVTLWEGIARRLIILATPVLLILTTMATTRERRPAAQTTSVIQRRIIRIGMARLWELPSRRLTALGTPILNRAVITATQPSGRGDDEFRL